MTLRLFRCPSWLLLLRICWNTWRRSFLSTHYQTNLKLKATGLLKYKKHFIAHQALQCWDTLQIFDPSLQKKWSFPLRISSVYVTRSAGNPYWKTSFSRRCVSQCEILKTKIGCVEKLYEMLLLVPLPSALIKQANFWLRFRRKVTLLKEI